MDGVFNGLARSEKNRSILIINPNTTQAMTDALEPVVRGMGFNNTSYTFFTAPSGAPSINTEDDAALSTKACLPALQPLIASHDAFLVCCYSAHPLVPALRAAISEQQQHHHHQSSPSSDPKLPPPSRKPVMGIFEASVATALQLLPLRPDPPATTPARFAILTTGPQYEAHLSAAVRDLLGSSSSSKRYAGTLTTGLAADELHSAAPGEVRRRMQGAAREAVLERGARALCLGCAGMVGLEAMVREACVEALGEVEGRRVWIVDGVVCGLASLEGVLRGRF